MINILCDVMSFLVIFVLFIFPLLNKYEVFFLRKIGRFPKNGCEDMTDVENFMKKNRRDLAIICYRLINPNASLKNAVKEVDKFH